MLPPKWKSLIPYSLSLHSIYSLFLLDNFGDPWANLDIEGRAEITQAHSNNTMVVVMYRRTKSSTSPKEHVPTRHPLMALMARRPYCILPRSLPKSFHCSDPRGSIFPLKYSLPSNRSFPWAISAEVILIEAGSYGPRRRTILHEKNSHISMNGVIDQRNIWAMVQDLQWIWLVHPQLPLHKRTFIHICTCVCHMPIKRTCVCI